MRVIKKPLMHYTIFLVYNDKDRHIVLIIKATNRAANAEEGEKKVENLAFFLPQTIQI